MSKSIHKNINDKKILKHLKINKLILFIVGFAIIGSIALLETHAASPSVSIESENGTITAPAVSCGNDTTASNSNCVQFKAATGSGSTCASPVFTTSASGGQTSFGNANVLNNVWADPAIGGPGFAGATHTQTLSACSATSWFVTANFTDENSPGAIQTYPDTQYPISGKTVSQYNSMNSCYGETHQTNSGEWDVGYDNWLNNFGIEIMIWNEWTDTGIYPPGSARATTIDGVGYHTWKGGGSNEQIYTRDTQNQSGCINIKSFFTDAITHSILSPAMTTSSIPNAVEYGWELAHTNGSHRYDVTNMTFTPL